MRKVRQHLEMLGAVALVWLGVGAVTAVIFFSIRGLMALFGETC